MNEVKDRGQNASDKVRTETGDYPQPGDEKVVEMRLVARKEDQRLLVGGGDRGDLS